MIKKLLATMLLIPSLCNAQKISVTHDKFTGKTLIKTDAAKVTSGLSLTFKSIDTSLFIGEFGYLVSGIVDTSDATIFLFTDNTTLNIYPMLTQSGNEQYYITNRGNIKTISEKDISSIRRYF